jgi:hypothetical protein
LANRARRVNDSDAELPGRNGRGDAEERKGALMTPAGSSRFASSVDDAGEVRADQRLATLSRRSPVRPSAVSPLPFAFRLRCGDVHSPGCEQTLGAHRLDDVVALARDHGALRHGLTAIWYTPERLAKIATAVTRPGD